MKERKKYKRMRYEKLDSLKLYQKNKKYIDNTNQENNSDNENNKENGKLFKNNSCFNIFSKINPLNTKRMLISPLRKEEDNDKKPIYEIEKGIAKSSLCIFSKNKYHFGTTKLIMPKYLKNDSNNKNKNNINSSNKISEQNHLISNTNFKRIYLINNKRNIPKKKIPNLLKIKNNNNNQLNENKINIYKKYNNGIGMDRHMLFNNSCSNVKSEIKPYTFFDNSTNEDISKQKSSKNNFNSIYSQKNNKRYSSLSTLEYTKIKKGKKNNKLFNSTNNIKEDKIKDISNIIKLPKKDINHKKSFSTIMSKYHFVENNYLIKINENKDMPEEIKNFNKNTYNILKKENEKLFSNCISIVSVDKFSDKFRDPLNNSFDRELAKERKIKEKKIIKSDILPAKKLLKEMEEEIKKRKIIKKQLKGKALMHKLKKIIIRNIEYLKKLNVTYDEIIYKYKRSPIAFSYFKTEELILAIRNKNYKLCCEILDNYKYIVLDFDYFNFTPLHWAVKINFYQIIPKLISYGAPINEQNFIGETPLHISACKNYYESTALLLVYLASPFIKDKYNRRPIDCTKDLQLIFIFNKIIELHLKYLILKQKNFYDNIQKDFIDFISVEFSNQLNPEILDLIFNLK